MLWVGRQISLRGKLRSARAIATNSSDKNPTRNNSFMAALYPGIQYPHKASPSQIAKYSSANNHFHRLKSVGIIHQGSRELLLKRQAAAISCEESAAVSLKDNGVIPPGSSNGRIPILIRLER